MPHSTLEHTADTGLEASADSLPQLIEELALGMFELMAAIETCPDDQIVEAAVEATSNEDLVVDTLSELLYLSETEGVHFCRFEVSTAGDFAVEIQAMGVPTEDVELDGPPIKAVTYHQLQVSETDEGWSANVYFDV
ncbi:MAG TPA: archease [Acidimicrobiia bacterium]